MKNLLVLAILFYCIPQNGGYFCKQVDFEIKEFPNGKRSASLFDGFTDKYKCNKSGDKWKCELFDKGAILLEPEHSCPPNRVNWGETVLTPVNTLNSLN